MVWPEIKPMEPVRREDAITEFLIISGLRNLEGWVLERVRRLMPLSIDVILNNNVLGPVPAAVDLRLRHATEPELSELLDRALQAQSIAELFPNA
jgi:hypothetical protein